MSEKGKAPHIWSPEEEAKLIELSPTHSHTAVADILHLTPDAVRNKYRWLAKRGRVKLRDKHDGGKSLAVTHGNDVLITLPHKYLDILRVKSDKTLVISDIHLPFIDWDLFYNIMRVAKRQGVSKVIVGGDVFDFKLFSTFPDAKTGKGDELSDAEKTAVRFFTVLLDQFDEVFVICGNHDFRLVKWSHGALNQRQFFRFLSHISEDEKRVKFSAYQHLILNDDIRVVHPNSAATNFELEGRAQSIKYQQSIVVTHVHRLGATFDPSGRYWNAGSGGLLDPTTQAYIMCVPSKFPMWNTGGLIIHGQELPYILHKYRTDWARWSSKRFL